MFSDLAIEIMTICKWVGMAVITILGVAAVVDWPGSDAVDAAWAAAAAVQAVPIVMLVAIAAICLHIALHMPSTRRENGTVTHRVVMRVALFVIASAMMLVEATIGGAGLSDINGATKKQEVSAEAKARRANINARIDVIEAQIEAQRSVLDSCPKSHKSGCINPAKREVARLEGSKLPLLEELDSVKDTNAGGGYFANAPLAIAGINSQQKADAFMAAMRTYGLQAGVMALAILIAIGSPKSLNNRRRSRDGLGTVSAGTGTLPPGFERLPAADKAELIADRILTNKWAPASPTGALTIDCLTESWPIGRSTALLVRHKVAQAGGARIESNGQSGDRVTIDNNAPTGVVLNLNSARGSA